MRLSKPGAPESAPTLETHQKIVNYAKTHGMIDKALALDLAWHRIKERTPSDFQRVFGMEIALGYVSLVLPLYRLNPRHLAKDETGAVQDRLDYFVKDGDQRGQSGGIGHQTVLGAFNDLRALMAIQQMLSAAGEGGEIRIEGDTSFGAHRTGGFWPLDRSAIVVGLHANRVADSYCEQPLALVQVERPGDGTLGAIIVDGQSFPNAGSGIYPMYFVVVRIFAGRDVNDDRICVICAGTTGTATLRAGEHLRDDWRWFSRFTHDLDIAAVYSIARENAEPSLELVKTAKRADNRNSYG
ncbi:MAG: hypothetical protein LC808_07965 [Actinobacteria bacterium]|nr:hypothetical protein [Actinomycetota bacterium]